MNTNRELKWHELRTSYESSDFSFKATDELISNNGIIGQEQAIQMLEMGLALESEGYNIYIGGKCDKRMEKAIKEVLRGRARQCKELVDLCYIYNFNSPEKPISVKLSAGDGRALKEDMDEFVEFIIDGLPNVLESKEALKARQVIVDQYEDDKEQLILALNDYAAKVSVLVKVTEEGIGFAPLDEKGEILAKDDYEQMDEEAKENINANLEFIYEVADEIVTKLDEMEKKHNLQIKNINEDIILRYMGGIFKYLKERYGAYPVLITYFEQIADDILAHLDLFEPESESKEEHLKDVLPWMSSSDDLEKLTRHYQVNLLVSHDENAGAPVIFDACMHEMNFKGKILIDTELNMMRCDFMNIRPGLFHKANGGYLILRMEQILDSPKAWLEIKQVLKSGLIYMDTPEDAGIALSSTIRPEPIKVNFKLILIGSDAMYEALATYDESFRNLFKYKVTLEEEIDNNANNVEKIAGYIGGICQKEQLPPVTLEALLKLVAYSSRKLEDPKKLPADLEIFTDLVREGAIFAKDVIDDYCIEMAIKMREAPSKKLEEKIDHRILDHTFLIDTEGKRVGQVNGLAVYSMPSYSFGRPVKITATTYKGKQGIINVEKEAELSGAIHTKGIHIITGFLGNTFAQNMPLSLNCHICFEQNYGQIDGDSASSAELYAILSSLADLGIKQNLATTGSVNQFGEIQPIGGVYEKIEGFFEICKKRGLKGDEGVIIPWQNQKELMLNDEIINCVKQGKFHIYIIRNIWDGMAIITGETEDVIKKAVTQKLIHFNC